MLGKTFEIDFAKKDISYVTNKRGDQPAHVCSLNSSFVVQGQFEVI